jgi:magnesium transporter
MEPDEAADVLEQMRPDDAADVLGDVEEQRAEELMRLMVPRAAHQVRSLLAYPEDTAGGLMDTSIITVSENDTVDGILKLLRRTVPTEDQIYYLYVVDDAGHLRGILSLRNLIVAPPEARVADIMHRDVESVRVEEPEEQVAQKLIRYDLLAIPVVDEQNHLQGVVTVNDVLDLVTPRSWQNRPRRMLG